MSKKKDSAPDNLQIDRTKLYTQKAYADKVKKTRGRICQLVKANELKIIEIHGAKLVYCDL